MDILPPPPHTHTHKHTPSCSIMSSHSKTKSYKGLNIGAELASTFLSAHKRNTDTKMNPRMAISVRACVRVRGGAGDTRCSLFWQEKTRLADVRSAAASAVSGAAIA